MYAIEQRSHRGGTADPLRDDKFVLSIVKTNKKVIDQGSYQSGAADPPRDKTTEDASTEKWTPSITLTCKRGFLKHSSII